jgi:hypothetical protein
MSITDTYFYLLENPSQRQIGLCAENIRFRTTSFSQSVYGRARAMNFETPDLAYQDWLNFGRAQGLSYAHDKHTILKIVLKVRDEPELLKKWIEHHAKIVGYHNLIILDCGSVDEKHLSILFKYRDRILIFDYAKYYDNIHTTRGNFPFFKLLSQNCRFLTILDADEYLVMYNEGLFSTSGICEYLARSSNNIFAGSWIYNAAPPAVDKDGVVWEQPIALTLSHDSLAAGTIAGKAIARTSHIFEINHLGHNLHVREVVNEMTATSLGRFFVFHLKFLSPQVIRRRILNHLHSKGIVPQMMSDPKDVIAFLHSLIDNAGDLGTAAGYIQKYLNPSSLSDVVAVQPTGSSMLLSGRDIEQIPELSKVIDSFNFDRLLEDCRKRFSKGANT